MKTSTEIINNVDLEGNDINIKAWANRTSDGRKEEIMIGVNAESWKTLIEVEQDEHIKDTLVSRLGVEVIGYGYQVQ